LRTTWLHLYILALLIELQSRRSIFRIPENIINRVVDLPISSHLSVSFVTSVVGYSQRRCCINLSLNISRLSNRVGITRRRLTSTVLPRATRGETSCPYPRRCSCTPLEHRKTPLKHSSSCFHFPEETTFAEHYRELWHWDEESSLIHEWFLRCHMWKSFFYRGNISSQSCVKYCYVFVFNIENVHLLFKLANIILEN